MYLPPRSDACATTGAGVCYNYYSVLSDRGYLTPRVPALYFPASFSPLVVYVSSVGRSRLALFMRIPLRFSTPDDISFFSARDAERD